MIAKAINALSLLCVLLQAQWLLFGDQRPIEPLRAPKPAIGLDARPEYQVLLFTAKWCMPCQADKRAVVPALKSAGIAVGEKNTDDVMLIDTDAEPEVTAAWHVQSIPTYILVQPRGPGADYVRRHTGRLYSAKQFQKTFPEIEVQDDD